jgi:hypothetical protein
VCIWAGTQWIGIFCSWILVMPCASVPQRVCITLLFSLTYVQDVTSHYWVLCLCTERTARHAHICPRSGRSRGGRRISLVVASGAWEEVNSLFRKAIVSTYGFLPVSCSNLLSKASLVRISEYLRFKLLIYRTRSASWPISCPPISIHVFSIISIPSYFEMA